MLTVGLVVAVVAVLAVGSALEFTEDEADAVTFSLGPLNVSFADQSGAPRSGPYIEVTGAAPGMRATTAVVRVVNTGKQDAMFRLAAKNLRPTGRRSLDDVLEATVSDASPGPSIYRGRLSTLAAEPAAPLAPGESKAYVVSLTWPDTPADDNPYQGAALSFDLDISATQT